MDKKESELKSSLSRKNFLGIAGKGLGAITVFPFLSSSELFGGVKKEDKLGIALVGLGSYAMGQLAPALRETKNCELVALVTGTPAKAERYGKEYNIPESHIYNYDNFDDIANNPDVDIVYVVLPNSMHAEYTIRAANSGKHVICEKPMAVSVEECEQMIAACKANNVTLNIGYRLHFEPCNQAIVAHTKSGKNGKPKYINSEFGFTIGNPNQWRLKHALAGGGAMMDVGIYCIQAARYSTQEEPIAVTAQEYKTDPVKFAEVDETITWQMEFPSGAVANCTTTYNFRTERLQVSYEQGNVRANLSPAYGYGGIRGNLGGETLDFGNPNQQALQMDAMAVSIVDGITLTTNGEEGLRDMKIIEAIYKSIAQNSARIEL